MDTNIQKFTPERVDEQVDELLAHRASALPNEHLVNDLQRMYQADERSLRNVWQRLGLEIPETAGEQPGTLPMEPVQPPASARVLGLERNRHMRQHHPFVRALSIITAACIAALLVGSLLWITNLARQGQSTHTTSHGTIHRQTSISLPQGAYVSSRDGLFRLNSQTHQAFWQAPLPDIAKIVPAGNVVYILQSSQSAGGTNAVVALDANTGKTLWTHHFAVHPQGNNAITAQTTDLELDQNRLYVGWQTWAGTNASVTTGHVYILNASNGSQQAVYATTDATWSLAVGDGVLAISADSSLQVYASATGKSLWHISINGPTNEPVYQISIVNNLVYALISTNNDVSGEGQAYIAAYKVSTGDLVWKSPVFPGDAILRFAVDQNSVYFGTLHINTQQKGWTGSVYAYDIQSNKLLWSRPVNGAVQSTPVISNGVVYVGADNDSNGHGRIITLSAATGAIKWQQPLANGFGDTFCVSDGVVYATNPSYSTKSTTPDGLYALNAENGSKLWIDTQFSSSPSSRPEPATYVAPTE